MHISSCKPQNSDSILWEDHQKRNASILHKITFLIVLHYSLFQSTLDHITVYNYILGYIDSFYIYSDVRILTTFVEV